MVNIIFRTDASHKSGSGHIMRCLTLAEELRELGATIGFITRTHSGNFNYYIKNKGFKVYSLPVPCNVDAQKTSNEYEEWLGVKQETDAQETIKILVGIQQVHCLIVDHYALDQTWERRLRDHVRKIMVIDDLANRSHDCDLLLDQNYIHDYNRYDQLLPPASIRLLGPKYALLRKMFTDNFRNRKPRHKTIKRVFIFFGGSDPDNLTIRCMKVFAEPDLKNMFVDVVIGAANLHQEEVKSLVMQLPNAKLHIQIENIAELMSKADISLGAGGTTTWERMAIGIPSIVVTIAENQVAIIRDLDNDGFLKWIGTAEQVDTQKIKNSLLDTIKNPMLLQEQALKGQQLITGRGAQIIAQLLIIGPNINSLTIQKAKPSDSLLYWGWANDPLVRENAFNQQSIKWMEHQTWFDKQLKNPDSMLLLIMCEFGPIGQVRFDRSRSCYMISYSISRLFRGFGLGKTILAKAINFVSDKHIIKLIGDVKSTNTHSKNIFKQLGFSEINPPPKKGVHRFQLLFSPSNKIV